MHTVFALLCFVVVTHWLIFPYPSGLLHWHCGNLTIAPVPAKQPWWIWLNTSCEFIMNDCIITTKQSTTKPCAYFLGYTACVTSWQHRFGACFVIIIEAALCLVWQYDAILCDVVPLNHTCPLMPDRHTTDGGHCGYDNTAMPNMGPLEPYSV